MARILSVEDDADLQRVIGRALFREGYEMHYAWNGREGFEKVLSVNPDLILLDLMLPIMNGIDFLRKLREQKSVKDIPTVVVTSYGDEANMLKCAMETMGAAACLRKPVQIQELTRLIKGVLGQSPPRAAAEREAVNITKGQIRADPRFQTVWINDRLVSTLPPKEFALLKRLMESAGPVPRVELLKALGYAPSQVDAMKQAIHRLRHALIDTERRRIKTTSDGYELIG